LPFAFLPRWHGVALNILLQRGGQHKNIVSDAIGAHAHRGRKWRYVDFKEAAAHSAVFGGLRRAQNPRRVWRDVHTLLLYANNPVPKNKHDTNA
jgi:hypothetical protein